MNKSFGRNREYEQHLEGKLPEELERLRHSVDWPVDPNLPDFHLANYYLEEMAIGSDDMHNGVDIQVPAETPVYAPENGKIILLRQDEQRDICLADIILHSPDSGIAYILAHINYFSLPEKIRNKRDISKESGIAVEKGEQIASVGYWPFENVLYTFLPEEMRKQDGYYCHLHFGTGFCPDVSKFTEDTFNPLLILKRL